MGLLATGAEGVAAFAATGADAARVDVGRAFPADSATGGGPVLPGVTAGAADSTAAGGAKGGGPGASLSVRAATAGAFAGDSGVAGALAATAGFDGAADAVGDAGRASDLAAGSGAAGALAVGGTAVLAGACTLGRAPSAAETAAAGVEIVEASGAATDGNSCASSAGGASSICSDRASGASSGNSGLWVAHQAPSATAPAANKPKTSLLGARTEARRAPGRIGATAMPAACWRASVTTLPTNPSAAAVIRA
jgi:hypothetical protein